ncbi:MAG: MFS transporter [Candidatus Kapabacteria bacterium]|nr:MFS transporter [Candidatus Kapabacteria bacterium]
MENKDNSQLNKAVLLAVTMTSNFFNPLMGAAVNVALPNIGIEFSLDAVMLSWITMAYLLASAVFLVPLGKIGDMWGRKKMFLLGNIFFGLATILCAAADSGYSLIIGRLLQGVGSAMMFSTSMAIVISAFPVSERGKVIGLNVSAVYVGLSVSPILGGVLTQTLGWRSLFIINAVVSLLVSIAIIIKIKAEWKENENDKFDWFGAIIYIPSMTALMFGFSKLPTPLATFFTAAGIVGLIIFVMMELKHPFPLLNMKLFFENRVFGSSNLSAFINYAATFAVSFILSLYLQYSKHLSPKDAGMILIAQPVLMAVTAIFSGRLSDKISPRLLASSGMAICVVGMALLSFIEADTSYIYLITALGILGFGFGLFSSPNTNMVMSSVTRNYYGIASATLSTMRATGMMFSMAIASLSIHLFVGNQKINDLNVGSFIHSSKFVFVIFTILCVAGIFLSFISVKNVRVSN